MICGKSVQVGLIRSLAGRSVWVAQFAGQSSMLFSRSTAPRVCREPSSSEPTVLGRTSFASCTGRIHDAARSTAHVRLYPAVSCILGFCNSSYLVSLLLDGFESLSRKIQWLV